MVFDEEMFDDEDITEQARKQRNKYCGSMFPRRVGKETECSETYTTVGKREERTIDRSIDGVQTL